MNILWENAILLGLVGRCSFVCVNVASQTLVMLYAIDTGGGPNIGSGE